MRVVLGNFVSRPRGRVASCPLLPLLSIPPLLLREVIFMLVLMSPRGTAMMVVTVVEVVEEVKITNSEDMKHFITGQKGQNNRHQLSIISRQDVQ